MLNYNISKYTFIICFQTEHGYTIYMPCKRDNFINIFTLSIYLMKILRITFRQRKFH